MTSLQATSLGLTGAASAAARPTPIEAAPLRKVSAAVEAANAPSQSVSQSNAKTATATPSPAELEKLVSQMQSKVSSIAPELQFLVDKDSGKSIIKLTDRNTSEIVWQFPSEQALQVTRALDRFQKGVMLNRNA